ncbi:hypothetical protein [Sphingomonas bacterium]|uniref:hypothetical protein n=1 Tax=Sphingomonas bacterium TaxID=1895847 RepID=UPI001575CEE4|nr:hypothetical protein [Sphingomonas bacterium]
MFVSRLLAAATLFAPLALGAVPAAAQFNLRSHHFDSVAVDGTEPGVLSQALPGATPAEIRAALVWNMRAALNVAALQCQFEPTLLTVPNYNAMLKDHGAELDGSVKTLTKYFVRTNKAPGASQKALDSFGTRTYSSFVTVGGQFGFCQTAATVGRDAVFQPRGQFGAFAAANLRLIRNSLFGAWGDELRPGGSAFDRMAVPRLDPACWDKKGWVEKKCGPLAWPPA